jgi:hypothetical protein
MTSSRIPFVFDNKKVYEWEQNLEDIIIYIETPPILLPENRNIIEKNLKPGEKFPKLNIKFQSKRLTIGIDGNSPYIDEELYSNVKDSECIWQYEGKEIEITLPKALKAETWKSVFIGHGSLDEFQIEEAKKKILKERFQEEHAGFDFSDANISGNVPDPKSFLGGIKYG